MHPEKIAILGGGNMGCAIVGGLLRRGYRPEHITVTDIVEAVRAAVTQAFAVAAVTDNASAVADASLVVIALKPQDARTALPLLGQALQRGRAIVVSVAAGIRIESLESWFGPGVPIVRVMPNRPALLGAGVTAMFAGASVQPADRQRAEDILRAVGDVVWVSNEDALDVVTALSGSGPAYFYLLAEAMARAAVSLGLESDVARLLSIGTLHGAGLFARESEGDLAQLRAEVTSAQGTTEAAMEVLSAGGFNDLIARAIEAGTRRSQELAAASVALQ